MTGRSHTRYPFLSNRTEAGTCKQIHHVTLVKRAVLPLKRIELVPPRLSLDHAAPRRCWVLQPLASKEPRYSRFLCERLVAFVGCSASEQQETGSCLNLLGV